MSRLQELLDDGIIDEVYNQLKTGKEAEVWLVSHRGEPVAAKLYKEREFRSFKNDAGYKEGRQVRNSRTQRAMDKGSAFGRKSSEEAWKSAEADALYALHAAGVRVPKPVLYYDGVLLMEVVGDAEGRVAPRLVEAAIPLEQGLPLYLQLRQEIIKMLAADLIHGDLSEFNILLGANGPVIIDFPQVVTAAKNSLSEKYFRRDLGNMLRFFSGIDPAVAKYASDADEIWRAYVRRDLSPGYVPTGRVPQGPPQRGGGDRRNGRPDQGRPPQQQRVDRPGPRVEQRPGQLTRGPQQSPSGGQQRPGSPSDQRGAQQPPRNEQRPGQHPRGPQQATSGGQQQRPGSPSDQRGAQPPPRNEQRQGQQSRGPQPPRNEQRGDRPSHPQDALRAQGDRPSSQNHPREAQPPRGEQRSQRPSNLPRDAQPPRGDQRSQGDRRSNHQPPRGDQRAQGDGSANHLRDAQRDGSANHPRDAQGPSHHPQPPRAERPPQQPRRSGPAVSFKGSNPSGGGSPPSGGGGGSSHPHAQHPRRPRRRF